MLTPNSTKPTVAGAAAQMELDFIQHVLFDPRRGNLTVIAQMLAHQREAAAAAGTKMLPNSSPSAVPPNTVTTGWRYNGKQQQQQKFVQKSVIAGCQQQQNGGKKRCPPVHFVPPKDNNGIDGGCHNVKPPQQQQHQFYNIDKKYTNGDGDHDTAIMVGTTKSAAGEQQQQQQQQQQPVGVVGRPKRHLSGCKVCARPSLYYYYGVKCCESCKQFFRRVISKQTMFNCFGTKNCQIGEDGARCRGCRLDKCLLVGMNPSMISVLDNEHSFEQFLIRLELRKRSAHLRMSYDEEKIF